MSNFSLKCILMSKNVIKCQKKSAQMSNDVVKSKKTKIDTYPSRILVHHQVIEGAGERLRVCDSRRWRHRWRHVRGNGRHCGRQNGHKRPHHHFALRSQRQRHLLNSSVRFVSFPVARDFRLGFICCRSVEEENEVLKMEMKWLEMSKYCQKLPKNFLKICKTIKNCQKTVKILSKFL